MVKYKALVYKGLGASDNGCNQLLNALRSCLDPRRYHVDFVSPEEIIKGRGLPDAHLIALGAGFSTGLVEALGQEGVRNLREHVLAGHCYLGLGAGGYLGCDRTEFDKGGPMEKVVERDLRFYPGVCSGPAYPGFQYGTHRGLQAVPIQFQSPHFSATFDHHGGGVFLPSSRVRSDSPVQDVAVLASFSALPGRPPAIVKTLVGRGQVVLSSVHLEYDMSVMINDNPELEHLLHQFVCSQPSQLAAFRSLLQLLGLYVQ